MIIAWGITGAGDKLLESISLMIKLQQEYKYQIDVYISKEGWNVILYYNYKELLQKFFKKIYIEKNANSPFIVPKFKSKYYELLIISPMTANTTSKIVYGIADSLITNLVSQVVKLEMNVIVYPVDQTQRNTSYKIKTKDYNNNEFYLHLKDIDLLNVKKLNKIKYIHVSKSVESITNILEKIKNNL